MFGSFRSGSDISCSAEVPFSFGCSMLASRCDVRGIWLKPPCGGAIGVLDMNDGFAGPERMVPPVAWLMLNIVVFLRAESFSLGIAMPIA